MKHDLISSNKIQKVSLNVNNMLNITFDGNRLKIKLNFELTYVNLHRCITEILKYIQCRVGFDLNNTIIKESLIAKDMLYFMFARY